jgi:hypothetical protein
VVLAHEARRERRARTDLGQHALERDLPTGRLIDRREHLSHTAARQQARQPVTPGDDVVHRGRHSPYFAARALHDLGREVRVVGISA